MTKRAFQIGEDEWVAAAVPFMLFVDCFVAVLYFHDAAEGSATDGRIKQGRYYLSLGHGAEQETDADRFYQIARRERVLHAWFAGLLVSGACCAYSASRARWRRGANP